MKTETKKTQHTPGEIRLGKQLGTIVSDSRELFDKTTGHEETDYYGGLLIAESILKKADAERIILCWNSYDKLKEINTELLEALKEMDLYATAENDNPFKSKAIVKAILAIRKAEGAGE